jgi:site-specific recombinase XerD
MKKAGLERVNEDGRRLVLYGWKHTFATDCVHNGIDLGVVQQMLGHAHISTTMQYVNVRSQAVLDGYKKIQQTMYETVQRKKLRVVKKTGTTNQSKV